MIPWWTLAVVGGLFLAFLVFLFLLYLGGDAAARLQRMTDWLR